MKILRILISFSLLFLLSCRWGSVEKEIALVAAQKQALGCAQFETLVWDAFDLFLVNEKRIPDYSALKTQVELLASKKVITREVKEAWLGLLQTLFEEAPKKNILDSAAHFRMFLAAMEVGDESTEIRKEFKTKISGQLKFLKAISPSKVCAAAAEDKKMPPALVSVPKGMSLAEQGMRWLFATAYQSCDSIRKPAMTEASFSVQGILDEGLHADGVGHKRKIADLPAFFSSHYYYDNSKTKSFGPKCSGDQQRPLIYDYGGKPFSIDGHQATLDLFTDDGTGTDALGIDCAAAIFSATATVGLRLKPNVPLRARNVLGINSRMFKQPEKNGLECYQSIKLTSKSSIQSGDIAAVNGHVLMIGEVGLDPFGIKNIASKSQCEQISAQKFDFLIWQSGSQKGGIGLNHIVASAYLKDAHKMREGFEAYAKESCKAQIDKIQIEPKLEKFAIIRNKNTPECQTQRIALKGESCVEDCLKNF